MITTSCMGSCQGSYFTIDQSGISLQIKTKHKLRAVLTVLYIIGWTKMNERLSDVITYGMTLDVSGLQHFFFKCYLTTNILNFFCLLKKNTHNFIQSAFIFGFNSIAHFIEMVKQDNLWYFCHYRTTYWIVYNYFV